MKQIIKDKFADNDIATIIQGWAYVNGRSNDGLFDITCGDTRYQSKNILICTGSRPDMPHVCGIDSPAVCSYNTMLNSSEIPHRIVMIGAGSVNIELAHIYNSLGSEIIILEENDEILLDTDNEICSVLRKEYARRGIVIRLKTRIEKIEENTVFYTHDGQLLTVEGNKILCDIGRVPNLENSDWRIWMWSATEKASALIIRCRLRNLTYMPPAM